MEPDEPPDPALLASFDHAWTRVAEAHPYEDMRGVDWAGVRDRLRPRAEAARTVGEVRGIITEMLGELGDSHYAVFAPDSGPSAEPAAAGGGAHGGAASAEPAVRTAPPAATEGVALPSEGFGNFPGMATRFHADRYEGGRVGYIGFSVFMPAVAGQFEEALREHREAGIEALIIDLRGNPGGLAGMVMGLSGWIVGERGAALGVMKTRQAELRFVVNPRADKDRFDGPVAVLIDGGSASTSELFAAGLQELGRAVIVGERSAGMSLPSVIETLPDGDLLQLVTADLHTPSGVRIEGAGVTPDLVVPADPDAARAGSDPVIDAAVARLLALESP